MPNGPRHAFMDFNQRKATLDPYLRKHASGQTNRRKRTELTFSFSSQDTAARLSPPDPQSEVSQAETGHNRQSILHVQPIVRFSDSVLFSDVSPGCQDSRVERHEPCLDAIGEESPL